MIDQYSFTIIASLFYLYGSVALFDSVRFDKLSIAFFFFGSLIYFTTHGFLFWRDKLTTSAFVLVGNFLFLIGSLLLWIDSDGGAICFICGSIVLLLISSYTHFTLRQKYLEILIYLCFAVGSILFLPQFDYELATIILFLLGSLLSVVDEIYNDNVKLSTRVGWLSFVVFGFLVEIVFLLRMEWLMDKNASTWLNYIAFSASICGILTNIPQIVHTHDSGKVDDFSTLSVFLWVISAATWLGYSISASSYALIFTNFVSLFTASFLLSFKRTTRKLTL